MVRYTWKDGPNYQKQIRYIKLRTWAVLGILLPLLWFLIANTALLLDGFWHYVGVVIAAVFGFFTATLVVVAFIPNDFDEDEKLSTGPIATTMVASFLFALFALLSPDTWLESASGPQKFLAATLKPDASTRTQGSAEKDSNLASSSSQNPSSSRSTDAETAFVFYEAKRLSRLDYPKSDCQLPYGVESVVTPISCENVEVWDIYIVSQHLCFASDGLKINEDQYLVLSKYETTSRSVARKLRERVRLYPDNYFENWQPNMLQTYYEALHLKKNEQVPIMETWGDMRTFQRNWDSLQDLREALRGIGC